MDYILNKIDSKIAFLKASKKNYKAHELKDLYRTKFIYIITLYLSICYNRNQEAFKKNKEEIIKNLRAPSEGTLLSITQKLREGVLGKSKKNVKDILKLLYEYVEIRNDSHGHSISFSDSDYRKTVEKFKLIEQELFEHPYPYLKDNYSLIYISDVQDNSYEGLCFSASGDYHPWNIESEFSFEENNLYMTLDETNPQSFIRISPFIRIEYENEDIYVFRCIENCEKGIVSYSRAFRDDEDDRPITWSELALQKPEETLSHKQQNSISSSVPQEKPAPIKNNCKKTSSNGPKTENIRIDSIQNKTDLSINVRELEISNDSTSVNQSAIKQQNELHLLIVGDLSYHTEKSIEELFGKPKESLNLSLFAKRLQYDGAVIYYYSSLYHEISQFLHEEKFDIALILIDGNSFIPISSSYTIFLKNEFKILTKKVSNIVAAIDIEISSTTKRNRQKLLTTIHQKCLEAIPNVGIKMVVYSTKLDFSESDKAEKIAINTNFLFELSQLLSSDKSRLIKEAFGHELDEKKVTLEKMISTEKHLVNPVHPDTDDEDDEDDERNDNEYEIGTPLSIVSSLAKGVTIGAATMINPIVGLTLGASMLGRNFHSKKKRKH